MTVYTLTEAEHKLDQVLEEARARGEVRIERADGEQFIVRPAERLKSPLDVPGVDVRASAAEIVAAVRESRERSG